MRPVAIAVGRPVHLFQFRILTQCLVANAALQEELKFFPAWISGRAAVARNRKGAASIGEFQAGRPVFAPQPTAKQAGHEPVARAQHIKDLDGKPLTALSLVEIVGYFSFENHRAHRPTLAYERRFRRLTYGPERLQRIGRAACYVEFFFRADDQVEKMQRRLQFGCNGLAFDEAVFTVAMAGKPQRLGRKSISRAVRLPFSRASRSAFSTAASVRGCDRCVPVASKQPDSAMKSGSISSSQRAISAQFSR